MGVGRLLKACLALAAIAAASGCAVYSTPDGEIVTHAPVVVTPPPAVVVSPFGFYGHHHHHVPPRRYYHVPRHAPRYHGRHSGPRYHGRPYHRF
jgi:hypothetical protein